MPTKQDFISTCLQILVIVDSPVQTIYTGRLSSVEYSGTSWFSSVGNMIDSWGTHHLYLIHFQYFYKDIFSSFYSHLFIFFLKHLCLFNDVIWKNVILIMEIVLPYFVESHVMYHSIPHIDSLIFSANQKSQNI